MAMADEISSAGGLQAESPNQYPVKRTMRAAASYNNFAKKIAGRFLTNTDNNMCMRHTCTRHTLWIVSFS